MWLAGTALPVVSLRCKRLRIATLFPYTTLFRSLEGAPKRQHEGRHRICHCMVLLDHRRDRSSEYPAMVKKHHAMTNTMTTFIDRKSTRLNSSHVRTSYVASCS